MLRVSHDRRRRPRAIQLAFPQGRHSGGNPEQEIRLTTDRMNAAWAIAIFRRHIWRKLERTSARARA
jgi:hypothetical protein